MHTLRVIRSSLVALALIALTTVLIRVYDAEPQSTSGRAFHITTRTAEQIEGTFEHGSSRVVFESRMNTPSQASLQVRVNDLVLDASADFTENLRILDGHGMALSAKDKRALIALSGHLERFIDPFRRTVPPHEDFLVRVVGYWAEAPVGLSLTRQEVRLPQHR
jgi:hypothetical protein